MAAERLLSLTPVSRNHAGRAPSVADNADWRPPAGGLAFATTLVDESPQPRRPHAPTLWHCRDGSCGSARESARRDVCEPRAIGGALDSAPHALRSARERRPAL